MTWHRRGTALAVIVLGSVVASSVLAGCSLLAEPPDSVSAAASSATKKVTTAPGVESVAAQTTLRDYQGEGSWSDPEAWVVHLTVNAEAGGPDLESAAGEIADALVDAPADVQMDAVVVVPHLDGNADAEIHFGQAARGDGVAGDRVRAARELASVSGVSRVTVGLNDDPPRVETTDLTDWPDVAGGIRRLPDFASGSLAGLALIAPMDSGESWSGDGSDGLRMELGTASPSPALIEEVTGLAADSAVQSIAFYSGEEVLADDVRDRPSLHVGVTTREEATALAKHLSGLDDERLRPDGTGRASFEVEPRENNDGVDPFTIFGYIGLPLGSDEPQDLALDAGGVAHSILFWS
jgi:hypothetical protein